MHASIHPSIRQSVRPSIYLSNPSMYPIHLYLYLSTIIINYLHLVVSKSIYFNVYLSIYLPMYPSTYLAIWFYLSVCLSFCLSVCLPACLPGWLAGCLYLSTFDMLWLDISCYWIPAEGFVGLKKIDPNSNPAQKAEIPSQATCQDAENCCAGSFPGC
jgi:hypothetical protein